MCLFFGRFLAFRVLIIDSAPVSRRGNLISILFVCMNKHDTLVPGKSLNFLRRDRLRFLINEIITKEKLGKGVEFRIWYRNEKRVPKNMCVFPCVLFKITMFIDKQCSVYEIKRL